MDGHRASLSIDVSLYKYLDDTIFRAPGFSVFNQQNNLPNIRYSKQFGVKQPVTCLYCKIKNKNKKKNNLSLSAEPEPEE